MNKTISFLCNETIIFTELNNSATLLDFLRKDQKLYGTKEGCREGDCGACTVLVGEIINNDLRYINVNSCLLPLGSLNFKHVVSIEGLKTNVLTPFQSFMIEEGGSQCGFCTPGFIMSLTGYFLSAEIITYEGAIDAVGGNICRCTGYMSIKRAIDKTVKLFNVNYHSSKNKIELLIKLKFVPPYFETVYDTLSQLESQLTSPDNYFTKDLFVGGGTDIFVQKRYSIMDEECEIHYQTDKISPFINENRIIISGDSSISDLEKDSILNQYFPKLADSLLYFGSRPIKNRATIAGNIVNASPIADMSIILLALNTQLQLSNSFLSRYVDLDKFYKGYKIKDLFKDEIVENIIIPLPSDDSLFNFEKVSKRKHLDIASVNSAILLTVESDVIVSCRISAGGVFAFPLYQKKSSEYLIGKKISKILLFELLDIVSTEISPISDVRGSKEYKALLLRQIIISHFLKLFPEIIKVEDIL